VPMVTPSDVTEIVEAGDGWVRVLLPDAFVAFVMYGRTLVE